MVTVKTGDRSVLIYSLAQIKIKINQIKINGVTGGQADGQSGGRTDGRPDGV